MCTSHTRFVLHDSVDIKFMYTPNIIVHSCEGAIAMAALILLHSCEEAEALTALIWVLYFIVSFYMLS